MVLDKKRRAAGLRLLCPQKAASGSQRQESVKTYKLILVVAEDFESAPLRGPSCLERDWESSKMDTKAKTVLIVEDNELNMKLFHDLLDAHGYNILQTKDGMEALDIAREHRPDLILMDIQLPEVSGLEVTKWLKEDDTLKAIPVVAVTAFAMKGDEEVIRQGGCEAYISKPISVTSFLDTVRRFIG
jgi:two-component system, cell cycle response regulator DivK